MAWYSLLSLILLFGTTLGMGTPLLKFDTSGLERELPECYGPEVLTCKKVSVNFDALAKSELLSIPEGLELRRGDSVETGEDDTQGFTFVSPSEDSEAIFAYHKSDETALVSGSVNWHSTGRSFRLQPCQSEDNCYVWMEVDKNHWQNLSRNDSTLVPDVTEAAGEDHDRLLAQGRTDMTTQVTVTISVYTTVQYRAYYRNSQASFRNYINLAIAETNQGYKNSKIPITLKLRCIKDSTLQDNSDLLKSMDAFKKYTNNDLAKLKDGADIAILLTNNGNYCGLAYFDAISSGLTLGIVQRSCATGFFGFGHEIGHLYGCHHNRETNDKNPNYPYGYGYLMRPPVNSGYRTVMANSDSKYAKRLNFYSSARVKYGNIPTGDSNNDNALLIIQRRFLMAKVGTEQGTCSGVINGNWTSWSSYTQCSRTCGGGYRYRRRSCTNPSPANGGSFCSGSSYQSLRCNTQCCRRDGRWGSWTSFGSCSSSCSQTRTRACNSPTPYCGGATCPGLSIEKRTCTNPACSQMGNWGSWSSYSSCSTTCGRGLKVRSRRCLSQNSTQPSCVGHFQEVSYCNENVPCQQKVALVAGGNGRNQIEAFSPDGGCSHYIGKTPHNNIKPFFGFIKGELVSCSFYDKRCFKYNPSSNTWTLYVTRTTRSTYIGGFIHGNKIYFDDRYGGQVYDGETKKLSSWQSSKTNSFASCYVHWNEYIVTLGYYSAAIYNLQAGTWNTISTVKPMESYGSACTVLPSGEILVVGSMIGNKRYSATYNVETNQWTRLANTQTDQGATSLVKFGNRIFAVGSLSQTVEEFDLNKKTWTVISKRLLYNHNAYTGAIEVPANWFAGNTNGCRGMA